MSFINVERASAVLAPRAYDSALTNSAAYTGVICFATAATSQRYAIPDAWRGRYISFSCTGLACQVAFGDSAVSVTLNSVSTVSSEVITRTATTGYNVPADQERHWLVPEDTTNVTHFAVVSSGTTGYWWINLSSI